MKSPPLDVLVSCRLPLVGICVQIYVVCAHNIILTGREDRLRMGLMTSLVLPITNWRFSSP